MKKFNSTAGIQSLWLNKPAVTVKTNLRMIIEPTL